MAELATHPFARSQAAIHVIPYDEAQASLSWRMVNDQGGFDIILQSENGGLSPTAALAQQL